MFWWVSHDFATVNTVVTICVRFMHRMHETVRTNNLEIFHNECAQTTLFDQKFLFRCVLRDFTTMKTENTNWVWVLHRMHETVRTNFLEILLQQTCLIHFIGPKTFVLMHFTWLCRCAISRHKLVPDQALNAWNCANEVSKDFFRNKNIQSSSLVTRLMFWCISHDFTTLKTVGTN